MKERSADEYPITQVNPVTGYRTVLYRDGTDADFLGWLRLLNGGDDAGYVYIRRPLGVPDIGSSGYVVMDFPPEFLGTLLSILQSGEPLQVRFEQSTAHADASAFLEPRE
jgi:hypothetical protein